MHLSGKSHVLAGQSLVPAATRKLQPFPPSQAGVFCDWQASANRRLRL